MLIYVEVIKDLEDRGYHVEIDTDSGIWTITGWTIKVDSELEKDLLKVIAARTKNNSVQPQRPRR